MLSLTFINISIVMLLTIVFGYLLGFTIVNTVDRRLSDISINLPKINLPRQNIIVNLDSKLGEVSLNNQFRPYRAELDQSFKLKAPQTSIKPFHKNQSIEGFQNPPKDENDNDIRNQKTSKVPINNTTPVKSMPHTPVKNATLINTQRQIPVNKIMLPEGQQTIINKLKEELRQQKETIRRLKDGSPKVSQTVKCQTNNDCNVIFGNGKNKCLSNGVCQCQSGSGTFCQLGPTYYKDPKDLTDRQLQKFKNVANFNKMTVQDYINWLNLFEDDKEQLSPRHLSNLKKINKGIHLTISDIPRERLPPPLTAQAYFDTLYTFDDDINLYTPQVSETTGLQIASNYSDYNDFAPPQSLKHLMVRPLTTQQEIDKISNRNVLKKVRPEIEHDWDLSTGSSTDPESKIKNHKEIVKLGNKISNLDDYASN